MSNFRILDKSITDYGFGTCMFAVFVGGVFHSVPDIDDGEDDDEQREDHTEADADPSCAAQTCVCRNVQGCCQDSSRRRGL